MSGAPLMLLDIGSTLVRASAGGPASRIAPQLGLTPEQRQVLNGTLMTTDFKTPEDVCESVGATFELDRAAVRDAVYEVWRAQERDAWPAPGAGETLTRLQREGWRLGLVSNIWRPYFHSVRRHFGSFFDRYIPADLQLLSFEFGQAKPSPDIFAAALRRAGVPAENAVMVGDSYFVEHTARRRTGHVHGVGAESSRARD